MLKSCAKLTVLSLAMLSHARADEIFDFYQNKTINLQISGAAGSGYDLYARLLSRHLGMQIPGSPKIAPQNVPAAGGITVANNAFNLGPNDGTLLITLHFTLPLYQAMGGRGVRFDAGKFRGVGKLLSSNVVIGVSSDSKSGVIDLETARNAIATIGSTGGTSNSTIFPMMINSIAGTKFKLVRGYKGEGDIFLAMERGELDGFGSYSYLTFKSVRPEYLTSKLFRPIVQFGLAREGDWRNVPTAIEVATNPIDAEAMRLASIGSEIGFSYVTPPNVPSNRLNALKNAFQKMIQDREFQSDAAKSNMFLRVASGDVVDDLIRSVLAAERESVERLTQLMAEDPASQCSEYPNSSLCGGRRNEANGQ